MSAPAHLWLEDENGSPIVGSCLMPLRPGSIELKSFSHGVTIPVDPIRGKLTGTRVHSPITIVKEFDQTTPALYRAVCEGRTLKKAIIRMYRILESGIESEYFNIILDNVKITTISPYLAPNGTSSTHLEILELRYETIAWKYTEGNIIYRDSWNDRCCA
ncbi:MULTISPECIES: type VI secretion system tube protein TssD [unclassified Tatumella]|uniref:Hcp family type VI secretion system effector n=1 Tax=unclassified Tatumella TaxID=2649542 RepID=UPI001BB05069|nr:MULTISPECIES: type VI secretion system tube protein TssD [unclassified Tatumella]MBS0878011.1 type VI secretion system tube protein Hcp [Tatumella sp. JGM82]MBS0891266.1 type VI secretion system tube protein Hcp [Tatumella sp. JGM94]MBS0902645.1 type VI secretion system tube protein Hcp [Tatumella sp. JGM100]